MYMNYFKKGIEDGNNYYSLSQTRSRSAAFFANATYSYKGRYTVNGTARYEGTNRMGKSRSARWLPTWNVSGAWNAHEEKILQQFNFCSFTLYTESILFVNSRPRSGRRNELTGYYNQL